MSPSYSVNEDKCFGFSCKTPFLNLIYHGAGTVVHLLLLKLSVTRPLGNSGAPFPIVSFVLEKLNDDIDKIRKKYRKVKNQKIRNVKRA